MQKQSKYLTGNLFDLFFSFEGRIGRGSYWVASILSNFLITATMLSSMFFYTFDSIFNETSLYMVILLLTLSPMILTIIISSLAITIKRYHDRGKSGYWSLMILSSMIPFLGIIFGIWMLIDLGLLKGEEHDNVYGKNIYDQDNIENNN